jgi:hypothetical protein
MKREQAEQIARKHVDLRNKTEGHEDALSLSVAVNAIMEAVAIEREACAKIVADAAPGFCGGRAETVLYSVAETIRARGE